MNNKLYDTTISDLQIEGISNAMEWLFVMQLKLIEQRAITGALCYPGMRPEVLIKTEVRLV